MEISSTSTSTNGNPINCEYQIDESCVICIEYAWHSLFESNSARIGQINPKWPSSSEISAFNRIKLTANPSKGGHGAHKPCRMGEDRVPGDPQRPKTFLSFEANEKKVAAYLGLRHTSLLRQLLLTWPVIKAFLDFDQVAEGGRNARAFTLIVEQEAEIYQASRFEKWPLGDQVKMTGNDRPVHFHIASILLHMEADIKAYIAEEETVKVEKNEAALGQLSQRTGLNVPARCTGCPIPALGPLGVESRLESINRCWALLRVFKILISRQYWNAQLGSVEGVMKGKEVMVIDAPRWMQYQNEFTPIFVSQLSTSSHSPSPSSHPPSTSQAVSPASTPAPTVTTVETQLDTLRITSLEMSAPPKPSRLEAAQIMQAALSLPISAPSAPSIAEPSEPSSSRLVSINTIWDVNRVFAGKEELDYLLKYCETRNVWVPDVEQTLHLDPMKIKSMTDFNERIGRLYSCVSLGLEIHMSLLAWRDADDQLLVSRMKGGWKPTREILMDPDNTEFSLRLVFRCVGEAGSLISLFLQVRGMGPQGNDWTEENPSG